MADFDYTKRIHTYLDFPFDRYGGAMTVEEYETLLLKHLASVKDRAAEWNRTQTNLTNVKVNIYIGAEDDRPELEISLIGQVPMSEQERSTYDESLKKQAESLATYEKQQLAALLKKYPQK